MPTTDEIRTGDAAVVARFLQLRTILHDRFLARVEGFILEHYDVTPTRRLGATLTTHLRGGFVRPGEGELWPVVFLSAVDLTAALCVEISSERVTGLGTMLNGPQRLRRRHWEDWYGWERPLGEVAPRFFELPAAGQEDAFAAWYAGHLEWLAHGGLLRRRGAGGGPAGS
jgi:hypothetical protein